MQKKTIPVVLLLALLLVLSSCQKADEQTVLKERLENLMSDIESHRYNAMSQYLAKDFSVGTKYNSAQFLLYARYKLEQYKNIVIRLSDIQISLKDNVADVTFYAWSIGAKNWLPDSGRKYFVESRWVKENNNWVILHLRWERE